MLTVLACLFAFTNVLVENKETDLIVGPTTLCCDKTSLSGVSLKRPPLKPNDLESPKEMTSLNSEDDFLSVSSEVIVGESSSMCKPCFENTSLDDQDTNDIKLSQPHEAGYGRISRHEPSSAASPTWTPFYKDSNFIPLKTVQHSPLMFVNMLHRHKRSRSHNRRKKRPQNESQFQENVKRVLFHHKIPGVGYPQGNPVHPVGSIFQNAPRKPSPTSNTAKHQTQPSPRNVLRSKETIIDLNHGRTEEDPNLARSTHMSKKAEWSVVSLSGQWCSVVKNRFRENHINQLNCSDLNLTNVPINVRFKIPDADSIRITGTSFSTFFSLVDKTSKAVSPNIYLESSNVTDVGNVLEIFESRYLLTLNLSQNQVKRLDKKILSCAPKLEYLSVSNNEILDLAPDTFSENPNLLGIHLQGNKLTSLPQLIFQKNGLLREIALDKNQIWTLPNRTFYGLKNLMYLYLSNNNLTDQLYVHHGVFTGLSGLAYLNLKNCRITEIHVDTLGSMTSLKTLVLANNNLTKIPRGAFQNLHQLKYLHLDNNQLVSVSSSWQLPASLKSLYLSDNQIIHIDDSIIALDLTFFYLHGNKLQTLSTVVQMYLAGIKNLTVHGNPWRCDCDLVFLIHLVKTSRGFRGGYDKLNSHHVTMTCETPSRGSVAEIDEIKVKCPPSPDEEPVCFGPKCGVCEKGLQRMVSGKCECMEGTYLQSRSMSSSRCLACPPQMYKNSSGDGPCSPCSSGSLPVSGPAPLCSCAAGFYTNSEGDCQRCPEGTYKNYAGVGLCTACTSETSDPCCAARQEGHVQPHSVVETSNNNDLALPIIIASTVIIVLGVILMFGLFGRRYRARRRLLQRYYGKMNTRASTLHSPASDEVRLSSASTTSSSVDFRCGPRHSLRIKDIGNMIGRGAFGQVYEANAYITSHDKEPVKVAVKKLKDTATEEEIRNLRDELEQMLNVGPHPNIIGLFGSVFYEGQCCIIMEYAELGDLLTYLKTECAFPLQYVRVGSDGLMVEQSAPKVEDNANLMMFAWQISKGMGHLEMHRVIHRDLATRNCLLTKGPIAKVSDFGLSKDAYELGHYKRIQKDRVPFKWLSPEALLWGQYSSKSDVWAFGVLLWELYTFGGTPYPQVTTEQLRELHEYGYRMSKPPACPDQLYRIMRACWRGDPRQRPSFRQLEETLDQLIQQTRNMEYIDLHEHGLKTSNPLPLLPEDMNDQVTSLDFIYRLKKQSLYQNRSTVPESPELGSSYESITLESGDVLYDETFSRLVAGMSKPDEDRENESTVTSGYLSMRSMSAQTM